jgi:hypothetical protein
MVHGQGMQRCKNSHKKVYQTQFHSPVWCRWDSNNMVLSRVTQQNPIFGSQTADLSYINTFILLGEHFISIISITWLQTLWGWGCQNRPCALRTLIYKGVNLENGEILVWISPYYTKLHLWYQWHTGYGNIWFGSWCNKINVLISLHLALRSSTNQILISSSTDFQSVVRTLVPVFH